MEIETNRAPAAGWLLIDCAHQGEVRIAHVAPGATGPGAIRRYETSIPTFTDVLLRYEQETGQQLRSLEAAIAIAGVPGAQSTIVERSRWVISRSGLSSLFGRPPTILNEVAAQAWALRASLQGVTPLSGPARAPDFSRPGRYVFVTYEEGVGTAVIDVDEDGRWTVMGAEGGQIDFVPASEAEQALVRPVIARTPVLSWEQVLMLRRDEVGPGTRTPPTAERHQLFAGLLGRFVSNLIYTAGAWNGAFLTGRLVPHIETAPAGFQQGLTVQRPYHRLLTDAGAWRVGQSEAVLKGCAALLAERHLRTVPKGPGS